MTDKTWVAIAAVVLVIIGVVIFNSACGSCLFDMSGIGSAGSVYTGAGSGSESGASGWIWIILLIFIIPIIYFTLLKGRVMQYLTPEGRKVRREAIRIEEKKQLKELSDTLRAYDDKIKNKLNAELNDNKWPLFELYRKVTKFTIDGEEYEIRSGRAVGDEIPHKDTVLYLIDVDKKVLEDGWNFGLQFDGRENEEKEFASLYHILNWYRTKISRGELLEMTPSYPHSRILMKFLESRQKILNSHDINDVAQEVTELFNVYNNETSNILIGYGLELPEFGLDDTNYKFDPPDDQSIGEKFREFTVLSGHGGIREFVETMINGEEDTTTQIKRNLSQDLNLVWDKGVWSGLKKAIGEHNSKKALKLFSNSLGRALHNAENIDDRLKRNLGVIDDLLRKINDVQKYKDYKWFTERDFNRFISTIDATISGGITTGGDLTPNRFALLYFVVFLPWIYMLLNYKLLYVIMRKYLKSLRQLKDSIYVEIDYNVDNNSNNNTGGSV